jgi:mannose-6-phosphate isomerase
MSKLYPLIFKPIYKEKIWGGQKLRKILNKDFGSLPNCGESWEISGVEGNISQVQNGDLKSKTLNDLVQEFRERLIGKKILEKYKGEFPLLIKFIDAADDLSIQVHPDDEMARQKHNGSGKTEMWYIMQADPGAKLVSGFKKQVSSEQYKQLVSTNKLPEVLNQEEVQKDDVFFIPAGRVHYIGKGLLLAEIQQTSDITYRIYDFDRVDDKGNKRELHTDNAAEALDFKVYPDYKTRKIERPNELVELVTSPYFSTYRLKLDQEIKRNYSGRESFTILIVLEGELKIEADGFTGSFPAGSSILIPAELTHITLKPAGTDAKLLETYAL